MRREPPDEYEDGTPEMVDELIECDLEALCRMIMSKTYLEIAPQPTPIGNLFLSYNYLGEMRKVKRVFFELEQPEGLVKS